MGLLKWLKREIDFSPSPPKPTTCTPSPRINKKCEVERNESYIRALSKFAKWRQDHHPINTKKLVKVKSPKSTANNTTNIESSHNFYEEIDIENIKQSADSAKFNGTKMEKKFSPEKDLSTIPIQNQANKDESGEQLDMIPEKDEPVYSVPLQTLSNLTYTQNTNFENYIEQHAAEGVIITDLDKSIVAHEDKHNDLEYFKSFSELIVCSLAEIKISRMDLEINFPKSYIQSGEIDSIEISYWRMEDDNYTAIRNNFDALKKLRHPNIVLLMGVSIDNYSTLTSLLLEPLKSSLYKRIHYKKDPIPLETCHKYTLQLTNAVAYLHKIGYVHTNISTRNVLLCESLESLKLASFELSVTMHQVNNCFNPTASSKYNLPMYPQLSTEYRKELVHHFYQAPEMLSNVEEYIRPSIQTDVYGICITLLEMLNGVTPYLQYSYDELVNVFQKGHAYLPIYEKERYAPFKTTLERGLEMQLEKRTANVIVLKNMLKRVVVPTESLKNIENAVNNKYEYPNKSTKDSALHEELIEMKCERTSTLKRSMTLSRNASCRSTKEQKRRTYEGPRSPMLQYSYEEQKKKSAKDSFKLEEHLETKCERTSTLKRTTSLKRNTVGTDQEKLHQSRQHIEEPCSPITRIEHSTPLSTIKITEQIEPTKGQDKTITPNKIYNVSIIIKSKRSADRSSHITSPAANMESNKLESASVKSVDDVFVYSTKQIDLPTLQMESPCRRNSLKSDTSNRLENEKSTPQKQQQLLSTEDFYIDDDFPSDFNLGANFELNFDYEGFL